MNIGLQPKREYKWNYGELGAHIHTLAPPPNAQAGTRVTTKVRLYIVVVVGFIRFRWLL